MSLEKREETQKGKIREGRQEKAAFDSCDPAFGGGDCRCRSVLYPAAFRNQFAGRRRRERGQQRSGRPSAQEGPGGLYPG